MIVAPVGGVAGALGGPLAPGAAEGLAHGSQAQAGIAQPAGLAAPAEGTAPAEGAAQVGQAEGLTQGTQAAGGVEAAGAPSGGFGGALTEAISSLEGTQLSADSAAKELATGAAKDPESSVVTVEDAQLAMDLASQLRTKAAEAAQSIFQTQV
jgi:flagellar hook-basal body complex protein FliE